MAIMAILIYNNACVCTGACWVFCVQGMLGVKIAFPEVIVFKAIACHEPPPLPHPQFSEGLTYKKIHQREGKWVGLDKGKTTI